MKLQTRFIILTTLTFFLTLSAMLPLYSVIQKAIMEGIGSQFAEKQVLYNRARVLAPLQRELALAQKLATSKHIKQWARDETNPLLRQRALEELEEYRLFFSDQSYFFVVHDSGNYYHNNRSNTYIEQPLRYQVVPGNPDDFWYFATIGKPQPYTLNVDYDEHLQVTKIWINVRVADPDQPLGAVGTGLNLSAFLNNVIDSGQPGIINTFVNINGAIQAHKDAHQIDFRTMSKSLGEQRTIYQFIDNESDREKLAEALQKLRGNKKDVEILHAQVNGQAYLIGLASIGELGWYNITLMEYDALLGQIPLNTFGGLLFVALLLLTVAIVFLINRVILIPIMRLNKCVQELACGTMPSCGGTPRKDELGLLEIQFQAMAQTVKAHSADLEKRVDLRTKELSEKNCELETALDEIQTLSGLLPICMNCKKIRDEAGEWQHLEKYICRRSKAEFSHGYCPDCIEQAYRDAGLPQETSRE